MTHYLIDGYNWLFRILNFKNEGPLKFEREKIIQEISNKISVARMQATLIFDSHCNPSPAEKMMAKGITIYYTDKGQTADEYILEFIRYVSKPQEYTVVTSDERLAQAVRQKKGHTLSIQEFRKMLYRIYQKKQFPKSKLEALPAKSLTPRKSLQSHYEEIFTQGIEEKHTPQTKSIHSKENKVEEVSDFERWKRIFESQENSPES